MQRFSVAFIAAAPLMLATQSAQSQSPSIDRDDIGGVVVGPNGPEAGVWVIAETEDLGTRFAKIVVTDDRGRYVVPDLPSAKFLVWARGYGLVDSSKANATPGQSIDIKVSNAPDAAAAAKVYPAAYWYSMMKLPNAQEVASLPGKRNEYLMWMKNMACVGCHQMGNLATRALPPSLGKFNSSHDAWVRRIQSGQAGSQMLRTAMGQLGGVPIKYLADWSDRIALGETPAAKPTRPIGVERHVVATVRDWSDPKAYMHDLSGTDRRNPTVNAYGSLYGAPELSTDHFPILNPAANTATSFHAPVRDADTPTTRSDPVTAPSPYWRDEPIWDSKANAHNPMLDHQGRVWYTARIRAPANPSFCKQGSAHPSAQRFPTDQSSRHLAVYDPKSKKYTFVDTCFSTHHLQFAEDANHTLWTSGGGPVVGWLDTKKFDATGDAASSQGWAPLVLDTNGNGKLDRWTEPNQPSNAQLDTRISGGFYAVMPNPADGSVWGSVAFRYPGAILRFDPGSLLTEIYTVPLPGYGV
ncbi:MAG TPA: carboxypeptidase-like regulatory domain-containing protein, partial [Steroidobacteraceae bacterium]|nr:carboxypeptidase-like regulatory domain-containing protein [Steroidobacteraceae bacterium]